LPVVIYRKVLEGAARGFDSVFRANGWTGTWRDGVYDYDHFHSNAHEVLGVDSGHASLQLGGDAGEPVDVQAGDVLILPAGTGHRRIKKSSDFLVSGAYPPGQENYDLCRSRTPEAELRITKVPVPGTDPVHGKFGPLLRLWR
jgi:uncharacterized protein YjlB